MKDTSSEYYLEALSCPLLCEYLLFISICALTLNPFQWESGYKISTFILWTLMFSMYENWGQSLIKIQQKTFSKHIRLGA